MTGVQTCALPISAYTYLVNAHWSPDVQYTFLNLADETAAVPWPIPLKDAVISDKDRAHPRMADVVPFPAEPERGRRILVIGANGQLGRELMARLPEAGFTAVGVGLPEVDIADAAQMAAWDWSAHDIVVNAASWTDVDAAQTDEGRWMAWRTNAVDPANLC